jgi:hypothetical protein
MYGNMRRIKREKFDPALALEITSRSKEIEAFKLAYTTVVRDTYGTTPSLNYPAAYYLKVVKALAEVQKYDEGCTPASFVDVVLTSSERDMVVGLTRFGSRNSVTVGIVGGRTNREFKARRIALQLDNLTDLASSMTMAQLLTWSTSNNYSPITLYLFGVLVKDYEMMNRFKYAVDQDMGRTEKLPLLIDSVIEKHALLYPNSLEALAGHGPPT